MTRDELENRMAVLLGGRASEHVVFGHLSTGAADDLAKVTDIARDMVMRYGMEETLGPVSYEGERPTFLNAPPGMGGSERRYSDQTAHVIDEAVQRIIERVFARAVDILAKERKILDHGAALLLEHETLDETALASLRAEIVPLALPSAAQ